MKKLIFIDNDSEKVGSEDLYYAKRTLYDSDLDEAYVKSITPIYNVGEKTDDEIFEMLEDKGSAIVTWSMFTTTHAGSFYQLFGFLAMAGRNQIKDKVYIDTACYLFKTLDRNIRDQKSCLDIMIAIESNYIIGKNSDGKFVRMRINLTDKYNLIKEEEIESLKALLS